MLFYTLPLRLSGALVFILGLLLFGYSCRLRM